MGRRPNDREAPPGRVIREPRHGMAPARLSEQVELEIELLSPTEPKPDLDGTLQGGSAAPVIVLVVDDDADMRRYIRRSLQRPGHTDTRVIEAASSLEALSLMEATCPDVVISDVVMPGMDGLELVRQIRLRQPESPFPILLVTGEAGWREISTRAREAGAQDVLRKPFNARKLCDVVARLLGSRGPPGPTSAEEDGATEREKAGASEDREIRSR